MKLNEYKMLLDLNVKIQKAAEEYYTKLSIPYASVRISDIQNTFVVLTRVYEGRDYVQSVSIWSLVDDPQSSGCSACKK